MKRKRCSEEQTVSILNEREAGASAVGLARKHGVAEQPVHRWKPKHGGMTAPDLKRLEGGEPAPEAPRSRTRARTMRMLEDVIEMPEKRWRPPPG